jgi:transcriptional regulator with PAS, ATPase and Fis domain
VGGGKTIAVDVRVIAATNLDLKKEVEAGRFREDLYYRLNVFPITVPSLRERLEDIPVFMNHFLRKYSRLHQRPVAGFTSRAINAMLSYKWPGNIRELENIVERGVIMASTNGAIDNHHLFTGGEELDSSGLTLSRDGALIAQSEQHSNDNDQLGSQLLRLLSGTADPTQTTSLSAIEVMLIHKTLQITDGNKSAAARLLGLSRSQLIYRLNNKGQ